ncbi:peptide deformylase [Alicyclobacillus curvatus]|jgi:peptide deformylase|nr:peptide deformylase [Alicyclobacillus curvatus]
MAQRFIRTLGDPILRVECKTIPAFTAGIVKLLDDMIETLYASDGRAGLAAPQVGVAKRVNVLDYDNSGLVELINPEIVATSGEQYTWEGCLSIPGYYGKVKRAQYVKVRSLNRAGEEVFYEGEGKLAVCMQHEIDHLDGILYIDHVEPGQLFREWDNKPVDVMAMIGLSRSRSAP